MLLQNLIVHCDSISFLFFFSLPFSLFFMLATVLYLQIPKTTCLVKSTTLVKSSSLPSSCLYQSSRLWLMENTWLLSFLIHYHYPPGGPQCCPTIRPHVLSPSALPFLHQWSSNCGCFPRREEFKGISHRILNICMHSFLKRFCFSSHFTKERHTSHPSEAQRWSHGKDLLGQAKGQFLFIMDRDIISMLDFLSFSVLCIFQLRWNQR